MILVNIASGNILLADGTKPLLKLMTTYHQWITEEQTLVYFQWKFSPKINKNEFGASWFLYIFSIFYSLQWHDALITTYMTYLVIQDDILTWAHFWHYWPFVWRIHQSSVDFMQTGQAMQSFGGFFVVSLNDILKQETEGQWNETI